jgi:hypothetical protein
MELNVQLHAPVALPPAAGIRSIAGWVGPSAGLDVVEKKNLSPAGIRTPAVKPIAYQNPYTKTARLWSPMGGNGLSSKGTYIQS